MFLVHILDRILRAYPLRSHQICTANSRTPALSRMTVDQHSPATLDHLLNKGYDVLENLADIGLFVVFEALEFDVLDARPFVILVVRAVDHMCHSLTSHVLLFISSLHRSKIQPRTNLIKRHFLNSSETRNRTAAELLPRKLKALHLLYHLYNNV